MNEEIKLNDLVRVCVSIPMKRAMPLEDVQQ